MNDHVSIKVIVYGYARNKAKTDELELRVPKRCPEAFAFIKKSLMEEYGLGAEDYLLLYNGKGAISSEFSDKSIAPGDIFKIMPVISGG